MAELGYEPNFQASNLASSNSRTIGIILPPSAKEAYENSFYLEVIRGISKFCNQHQYINTIITGENDEEVLQVIRTMTRSGQVDGFILLYSKQQDTIMDYLDDEGLLYVLIGKAYQLANQTIYINNDNILAGQDATEYLYQLGHRKIAYLGCSDNLLFSYDRKAGYQIAASRHNLPVPAEYCVEAESIFSEDTSLHIQNLLQLPDRPTAVIVCDDILAVMLERICQKMGISIPEDLSIISFNDSIFAKLTSPELTSIDINSYQLGIESASQIINHIENPNLFATKIIVPHQLIKRDSCRKITES